MISAVPPVVARPSRIEGLGIFTTRALSPGESITRVAIVREITADAPLRPELDERVEHCAYPDGRMVLVAYPERHVNHSCDPNAYERFDTDGSCLVARRPIAAGDEITIDYNVNITGGTAWPCRCGASRCRGVVAGEFFDLPIAWQREYRPLLADWFVRRNAARIAALDGGIS